MQPAFGAVNSKFFDFPKIYGPTEIRYKPGAKRSPNRSALSR